MISNHTQTILERYHMQHLKSDVVKRIIMVYDDQIKDKEAGTSAYIDYFMVGECVRFLFTSLRFFTTSE